MKALKFFITLFIISLVVGCGNDSRQNNFNTSEAVFLENDTESKSFFSNNNLKSISFKDGKTGMTVIEKQFPSNWNVNSKPDYSLDNDFPIFLFQITSDNGLMIQNSGLKQFIAYSDQQTANLMANYGVKNIQSIVPINTIIQNEITPKMQSQGFQLVKTYREQDALNFLNKKKAEKGFQHAQADIVAAEWTNNSGKKAVTYVGQLILPNNSNQPYENFAVWNYGIEYLITNDQDFESDKAKYLATIYSEKENPQWEQYQKSISQKRQQQQQQLAVQHQQRMQQRQMAFNQHQANMRDRSAAMDASHASFMNNLRGTNASYGGSYSSNSSHDNFINMIREEETVNYNGNSYQVDAGADQYWMNNNGDYIMSNDAFYNPNTDNSLNNQQWDKVYPNN